MKVTIRNDSLGKVRFDPRALDAALARRFIGPAALADRLGVTRMTVWRARRGQPVRAELAKRIARALCTSMHRLVVPAGDVVVEGAEDLSGAAGLPGQRRTCRGR
jgi:hypothetical protein